MPSDDNTVIVAGEFDGTTLAGGFDERALAGEFEELSFLGVSFQRPQVVGEGTDAVGEDDEAVGG